IEIDVGRPRPVDDGILAEEMGVVEPMVIGIHRMGGAERHLRLLVLPGTLDDGRGLGVQEPFGRAEQPIAQIAQCPAIHYLVAELEHTSRRRIATVLHRYLLRELSLSIRNPISPTGSPVFCCNSPV